MSQHQPVYVEQPVASDWEVEELDGIYGATPTPNVDLPQVWDMPWGKWVVNATTVRATVDLKAIKGVKLAAAGPSATFDPLADPPLSGEWVMSDPGASLTLEPMSQAILIDTTRSWWSRRRRRPLRRLFMTMGDGQEYPEDQDGRRD